MSDNESDPGSSDPRPPAEIVPFDQTNDVIVSSKGFGKLSKVAGYYFGSVKRGADGTEYRPVNSVLSLYIDDFCDKTGCGWRHFAPGQVKELKDGFVKGQFHEGVASGGHTCGMDSQGNVLLCKHGKVPVSKLKTITAIRQCLQDKALCPDKVKCFAAKPFVPVWVTVASYEDWQCNLEIGSSLNEKSTSKVSLVDTIIRIMSKAGEYGDTVRAVREFRDNSSAFDVSKQRCADVLIILRGNSDSSTFKKLRDWRARKCVALCNELKDKFLTSIFSNRLPGCMLNNLYDLILHELDQYSVSTKTFPCKVVSGPVKVNSALVQTIAETMEGMAAITNVALKKFRPVLADCVDLVQQFGNMFKPDHFYIIELESAHRFWVKLKGGAGVTVASINSDRSTAFGGSTSIHICVMMSRPAAPQVPLHRRWSRLPTADTLRPSRSPDDIPALIFRSFSLFRSFSTPFRKTIAPPLFHHPEALLIYVFLIPLWGCTNP